MIIKSNKVFAFLIIMTNAASKLITYRPMYDEREANKLPQYRMQGGAGVFAPTVTIPKWSDPETHGWEIYLKNFVDSLHEMSEEGNIHGNALFIKTYNALTGLAKTQYQNLIEDPAGMYMPAAGRTDADWEESIRDLTSLMHDNTFLGNDIQEATKEWKFEDCRSDPKQAYPDNFTAQEARIAQIDRWAEDPCHFDENPLDNNGKKRRWWKRLPSAYKKFLKTTRGIDPFAPGAPTLQELVTIVDQKHRDSKELAEKEKAKKRKQEDADGQGRSNKRTKWDNNKKNSGRRNGGGNKNESSKGDKVQSYMPKYDNWTVNLGGVRSKWSDHKLNPKSRNWDYEAAKNYVYRSDMDGGKGSWYKKDIFHEAARNEKSKRGQGQSHYQQALPPPPYHQPSQSYYGQAPQGHPMNNNGQGYAAPVPPSIPPPPAVPPPSSYYQWQAPGAPNGNSR